MNRTSFLTAMAIGVVIVFVALYATDYLLFREKPWTTSPESRSPPAVSRVAALPARPACDRVLRRIPVGRIATPVNPGVRCAITVEYCSGAVIFNGPEGDSPIRWPGAPELRTAQPWVSVRAVREPAEIIYLLHPIGTSVQDPIC